MIVPSGIMVDIETLSTRSNAVVLSVGAKAFAFAETTDSEPVLRGHHLWVLDTREQLLAGRHVDADTVAWWQKQSEEARQHFCVGRTWSLEFFCIEFKDLVNGFDEVWAHGTDFDIPILNSLYRDVGFAPPWKKYNVVRDVRTIVTMFPQVRVSPDAAFKEYHQAEHDPVMDCVTQIWNLWEHWPS